MRVKLAIGILAVAAIVLAAGYLEFTVLSHGYFDRPAMKIVNMSGHGMDSVILEARNNSKAIGSIPEGGTVVESLENPFGESGLKLKYILAGKQYDWNGGYIESSGGYKITVAVGSGGNVEFKYGRQ